MHAEPPSPHPRPLQTMLQGDNDPTGPHACRVPRPAPQCDNRTLCAPPTTYRLVERTPGKPAAPRGQLTVFSTSSGDIVVTATATCGCFLSISSAVANALHMGRTYNISGPAAEAASCPAGPASFAYPTTGIPSNSYRSCMSWTIPAAAANAVGADVVLTMLFEMKCYTGCSAGPAHSVAIAPAVSELHDVRCHGPPHRGILYRRPRACVQPSPPARSSPPSGRPRRPPPGRAPCKLNPRPSPSPASPRPLPRKVSPKPPRPPPKRAPTRPPPPPRKPRPPPCTRPPAPPRPPPKARPPLARGSTQHSVIPSTMPDSFQRSGLPPPQRGPKARRASATTRPGSTISSSFARAQLPPPAPKLLVSSSAGAGTTGQQQQQQPLRRASLHRRMLLEHLP
jgi:hypothetical protein